MKPATTRETRRRRGAPFPGPVRRRRTDPTPPNRPAGAAALPVPAPPLIDAVSQSRPVDLPRRIAGLNDEFLSVGLPSLNNSADNGEISLDVFAQAIREKLAFEDLQGLVRIARRLDNDTASYYLGALGAIASSLVRHERMATGNKVSSAGVSLVPGLEPALLELGDALGRAPRDNHDTAWAAGFPISYTGSDGEARFGHAVREANRLLGECAKLLEPIRTGELSLAASAGVLSKCRANVREYALIQANLAKDAFGPEFLRMRNFLATYEVGGQEWQPPNATYTVGWTAFELGLGLLGGIRDTATERSRYMSREDRARVAQSVGLPTLCELVARELALDELGFESVDPITLAGHVAAAPVAIREGVLGVRALAREAARLAGTHWGVIKKNLVEPVEAMSDSEREALGVAPTGGVSGTGLEHTSRLSQERYAHPLVLMKTANQGESK